MDEGTLNDLLECSVCLERLDTSSKVLPCQHTFCRKCLEEIYHKHKELRCPECRVLVKIKIDDLPPNVLLMRILEGIKNSGGGTKAPKPNRGSVHPHPSVIQNAAHIQQHQIDRVNNRHAPGHTVPHQPYAKALFDYTATDVGDLSFKRGDIIILKKRIDSYWYEGECGGKHGVFPSCYVQVITPVPSNIPQCKALYDFRMNNDEEEGCLAFNKGDIINVIRRVDENWAEGKLDGKIGIFPLAFVELNNLARSLMKLSTNVQPGPSKVAPPTPTVEGTTPLIPTDHSTAVMSVTQNQVQQQQGGDSSANITSSSSSTTPNVSSSNTSSSSSTAPSSPASPPSRQPISPRNSSRKHETAKPSSKSAPSLHPQTAMGFHAADGRVGHHQQHAKDKRHSLTNVPASHHNRHSTEIPAPSGSASQASASTHSSSSERSKRSSGSSSSTATVTQEVQLPAAFMALYPYKPQKSDELELKKGGIYMVSEICQDGWYKGVSNRTQKCGVFPGNYVTPARGVPNQSQPALPLADSALSVSFSRASKGARTRTSADAPPPELPPRAASPASGSVSWHAGMTPPTNTLAQTKSEKGKDRKDKGSVSLMRRLASIKLSKSPPPSSYSMDNPVFEDRAASSQSSPASHPVHVRSGSCPSQLLQIQPVDHHRLFTGSSSHRVKHKERPSILHHGSSRSGDNAQVGSSGSSPDVHRHKKSNSLDAGNHQTSQTGSQDIHKWFRCIAPYPPNSAFELELQVNDIIYVHKKREDGWYKGTQQRTGKTGLFPVSFVERF
ncbi:SH3 domain containing ring finger posh isoform X2 [Rhynchophorus ferrugineus]|uniref:SH3 domain containing ring finger posh isoform X2 n=1 Tax=Rhynchophorus ferrugineus TaxID=354439 RepID=UPI003FCE6855